MASLRKGKKGSLRRTEAKNAMMYEFENPSRYLKADLHGDIPIYHSTVSISDLYAPDSPFAGMYTHDMIEISIVTEGSGVHIISSQAIPCKSGDVYIVQSGVAHGYLLTGETPSMKIIRLMFDPSDWFTGEIADPGSKRYCYGIFSYSAVSAYAMLNRETEAEIRELCRRISAEIASSKLERRSCISSYLSLVLITLGRYVNDAIRSVPEFSPKDWRLAFSAVQAIEEQFGESDFTLESIAKSLFVTPSRLSRLFKQIMGKSFSEHLKSTRLIHACKLLQETDFTVEEIVKECGLRDLPSFYHSFYSYAGMTPNQYRRNNNLENQKNINKQVDKIMVILSEISENLQKGKSKVVKEMVAQAIEEGCDPQKILEEGLLSGMSIIGEKFKNNEVFVPEVLVAARAMNMGVSVLKPYLASDNATAVGRVCIGTVQGDLHDIGKNLVRMMLEGKGLEVIDLGCDVPAEKFIETAINENCQVICCSALLTTTMSVMADVVKAAEAAGIRDKVKIMIGGAPITEDFCKKIGADCYTLDAASAADAAVAFCKQ